MPSVFAKSITQCCCIAGICVLLSACTTEQYQDPRYLYRQPPSTGPSVRNIGVGEKEDGRLYNENGQRVEAFMPSDTDTNMPSDKSGSNR